MQKYKKQIFNTIFIDIETVSEKKSFHELSQSKQSLWEYKATQLCKRENTIVDDKLISLMYCDKAAIYAEFGKIICISIGMFYRTNGEIQLLKKSFYSLNEKELLEEFIIFIKSKFNNPDKFNFCGHNIREFDIPYICRRALIKGIKLPTILDISGKKAWQLNHLIDTLQLWKFGDYKHYTSLSLLCNIFNIPDSKNDMDGSKVARVFWKDNDLERIVEYCEEDITAVAYLFAKMIGRNDIIKKEEANIVRHKLTIKKAS